MFIDIIFYFIKIYIENDINETKKTVDIYKIK